MIAPDRLLLLVFCLAPWLVAAVVIGGALWLECRSRCPFFTVFKGAKK